MYENKYNLTPDESMFLAKKKWDENVYCGMKMENRAVTFPQTKTILQGVNVPSVQLDDIQAILNMRDAWKMLMSTVGEPITLDYLCRLNGFIARNEALYWGVLRTGRVGISGTEYEPAIPDEKNVSLELSEILSSDSTATEKALDIFCWGTKGQFFWDGNKRTSLCLANKILLDSGCGILTVTDAKMEEFNKLLLEFYNGADSTKLKEFLYTNALHGIEF